MINIFALPNLNKEVANIWSKALRDLSITVKRADNGYLTRMN